MNEPKYVHGRKFGADLCDLLGLDKKRVRALTIHVGLNDAVNIDVNYILRKEEVTALGDEVRKYRLIDEEEWQHYRFAEGGAA